MKDWLQGLNISAYEQKNIRLLIDAIADTEIQADIVGDGELKEDLINYAHVKKSKVFFKGVLHNDELAYTYNKYKVFVLLSTHEGNPKTLMEAMACGTACITTDVGATSEYTLPGKTALMSPPGNVRSIANNLVELAIDEERREKIARSGYDFIKKFNWDDTVNRLEEIFFEALKDGEGI